ncbi:uncharacterized protein LOC126416169 isoform X1 [Schistocerca serialis cubense]|uniref:uncharacterized protein LOC126416169 isoform X1 n=1 Tax=Schistocerca serialis cubense TaxID=2023355 RepID=UPI00214E9F2A|nr:uncharacterized protein LOC126416169 isoform X1 [Schistocerca serialis cubense]
MHTPHIADDMSQQLSALRQQLLQTGETEEVAAVLLPRMIELLFTPPAWATPDRAVTMSPSSHTMESLALHSKASARFLEILQQQKPPPSASLVTALLRAAAAILVGSDSAVSHIWLDMLLEAVDTVPVEIVQSEILPVAVRQSQASNNTWARITACHLFGKVCLRLDPLELQSEVIPGLVALCQDVAWEVRSAACEQLAHAASCFRSSPLLLSTLCELGADESEAVLVSVIGATASSLRTLTPDTLVSAVTPLVMRLAREAAKEGSPVLIALATHYGDLCHGLKGYMSPEERRWLVDMFQNMVRMGLQRIGDTMFKHLNIMMMNDENMVRWTQQVRSLAAASLPAVSQFLLSEDRRDVLLGIVRDLVFDPHPPVRCSLASGLHKVAVVLGVENCGLLKYDFTRLLCDQNLDVLRALMPSVRPILLFMKEGGIFSPDDMGINNVAACTETLQALLTCEATVAATLDWRLYVDVISQYEVLPQCMPSDIIYDAVISLLQQRILSVRQLPSRCALSRAILKLLRFNERPEHRDDIRNRLVENLMKNKNSYHRMCYLRLCDIAMEIFSAAYFKTWFFSHVISLSEDSVATLRQVAARMLPSMKTLCKLPEDKNLLEMLDSSVNRLLEDSDREVQTVAKSVHSKLKEIEVVKATDEVDLIEKQRVEEEIAVEQKEPPESWLQSASLLSGMINNGRTRDLQPLLKMSVTMPVATQTISTINDLLLATQDLTLTQSRSNQFAHPASSAQTDSGSTGSSRVLQGQDFVIDAGIHLSGKQTTHIPSPRRGHSQQGRHQNRRSWAGSSSPKSRGQTDNSAPLQGTSDIDLLDTGQSDNGRVVACEGAAGGANYQQNPLLQNVKPTGIARGVIHNTVNKDRSGASKVPMGKPGRASSSLLGSPVIMRSNRGRGNRDTAHRNSVAAIPVRTENVQPSGRQGEEDGKASVVRRRSGQFSGGKTAAGGRGTQYTLKRNSAIEMHLGNSRDREHFTGRRSATFEGIPTYQSPKSVIQAHRTSSKTVAKDKDKFVGSSIPSSNITVQKENDETQNAGSNIKVSAQETRDSSEKEMMPAGKLDTNKKLFSRVNICGKAVANVVDNKHENYVEEGLSLVINESKVQFDETKLRNVTDQTKKNTAGESNETVIISGCSTEKGDGEKAVHNNIITGKVEARSARQARNNDCSQINYISALDKQGSKNKMGSNNSIHKGSSEQKAMNYLHLREASGSPENPGDYGNAVSKGVIKSKILSDNQLEDLGGRQQTMCNTIDQIPFNATGKTPVKEEFLDELGGNFSPVVRREPETAVAKNDRRDISTEKNGETVKQISRRSFNLDNYAALRPSPQDMHLLVNSSPTFERQTVSTVGPAQRRISSNRHSFGAVLATPVPPRRHSSLDRLGGPRSDLHEEGLGSPRSGSCRSSPTSGLPASKLPILRRQHPP